MLQGEGAGGREGFCSRLSESSGCAGKLPLPGPCTQPLGGQRAPTPAVPHQVGVYYVHK